MINPTHRLKKFIKYSGDGKADDFHVTEVRGWLGSGVKDKNGVEIFEDDIVKFEGGVCGSVRFDNAQFYIDLSGQETPFVEVVGHIATE